VAWAVQSGPRGTLVLVIESAFSILQIAILVRVVSSWFGISPYAKWMRPVMWLTNWLVEPIRRMLPPFGMLDFSPLVALLVLWLARTLLLSVL
jgi:YggT family protein